MGVSLNTPVHHAHALLLVELLVNQSRESVFCRARKNQS